MKKLVALFFSAALLFAITAYEQPEEVQTQEPVELSKGFTRGVGQVS